MKSNKQSLKDEIQNPASGFMVPIAILVGGALIIWGITKMLSGSAAGYKKLVQDLNSKTFGNRWVAAYDLSKYIASEEIPSEDIPWLIQELSEVYDSSQDERTRNFIVLALGALENEKANKFLNGALASEDKNIRYSSIIGLSKLDKVQDLNVEILKKYLSSDDEPLKQVILMFAAKHKVVSLKESIKPLIVSSNTITKYNSITALLNQGENIPNTHLEKLFFGSVNNVDLSQLTSLKLNILKAIHRQTYLVEFLEKVIESETNKEVKTKAKQALLRLK